MERHIPFVQSAVFADERYRFSGNQLATFWDSKANISLTSEEMLGLAREMNYSESTFIFSSTLRSCSAKVRIFTPSEEIPFAGHPTLGTALVMKYKGLIEPLTSATALELGIGPIAVQFIHKAPAIPLPEIGPMGGQFTYEDVVRMTQRKPEFKPAPTSIEAVLQAVGLENDDLSADARPEVVSTGFPFLIIPITGLQALNRASPNPRAIVTSLEGQTSREIVLLSRETLHDDSDVQVRMFAPAAGVLEDPATGSAAGPIGAYIEKHRLLNEHLKGHPIVIEQGYQINRRSRLIAEVQEKSVLVSGLVRINAEGMFHLS